MSILTVQNSYFSVQYITSQNTVLVLSLDARLFFHQQSESFMFNSDRGRCLMSGARDYWMKDEGKGKIGIE